MELTGPKARALNPHTSHYFTLKYILVLKCSQGEWVSFITVDKKRLRIKHISSPPCALWVYFTPTGMPALGEALPVLCVEQGKAAICPCSPGHVWV